MDNSESCTVDVAGLAAFNISAFQTSQHVDQEKNHFEAVTPASCFNEVVASQDGSLSRHVANRRESVLFISYIGFICTYYIKVNVISAVLQFVDAYISYM
jgi:hypothetical protein